MNKVGIIKNDKGATLVMVIVAMLFVGIIAAIAMTMTVGNSKSTRVSIETSENFYSSENVLNDLEMYLKKLATDSATKAYADVLNEIGTKSDSEVEADFESVFATELRNILNAKFSTVTPDDDAYNVLPLSMLQDICLDRYGLISNQDAYTDPTAIPIKIKYEKIDTDEDGKVVLRNVVISLKDDGFESTITTDITFNVRLPKTGQLDSSGIFDYDIDHFLLISGRDIKANGFESTPVFTRGAMSGTYVGNIYAYRNLILQPKLEAGKSVNLRSYYIITGNSIIADKGNTGSGTLPYNGSVTIAPINRNSVISKPNFNYGTNIWTDNFKIYDGSVSLSGVGTNLTANTYLGGNLELNGDKSEFILSEGTGKFIGYSYNSVTNGVISSAFAPKSSAIVLNGLGAKLDLSGLSELDISGTAYTSIADLQNVENQYSSYFDTGANLTYYTQGESITYRALQALYLVPGNCIAAVGHNPMTIGDVLNATGKTSLSDLNLYSLNVTVPEELQNYVNPDDKYRAQYVRYAGSGSVKNEDIIYLFWNFKSKAAAVEYFSKIITTDSLYFSGLGLSNKQIQMLTDKSGYIKLPYNEEEDDDDDDEDDDRCDLYGNAVYNNNGLKIIAGEKTVVSGYDSIFGSLKSAASESRTDNGSSLLANMFPSNRLKDTAGGLQKTRDLVGPLDTRHDKDGKQLTFTISTSTQYKNDAGALLADQISYAGDTDYTSSKTYKLVTGDNINMSGFNPDYTYLVITPGNVTFTTASAKFRGMIIAGGDISIPENMDMECLGMLSYDQKIDGGEETHFDTTEFRALLEVCIYDGGEEDPSTGNFKLRQIFNVADTSGTAGSGNGDDFVTIKTNDWKRN